MRIKQLAILILTIGLALAVSAGEEIRTKMAIAIVDGDGDAQTRIELDSDELGFNLHDMQVGENRSVVDKTGRVILVTREAHGFAFDVDGKTIKMPLMHGHGHGFAWKMDGDAENIDVEVMHDSSMRPAMDGVMIVSEKPIDDATQEAIRSVLLSAGHDSEVRFMDRESGHPGPHRIRRIEKRVEVTD